MGVRKHSVSLEGEGKNVARMTQKGAPWTTAAQQAQRASRSQSTWERDHLDIKIDRILVRFGCFKRSLTLWYQSLGMNNDTCTINYTNKRKMGK